MISLLKDEALRSGADDRRELEGPSDKTILNGAAPESSTGSPDLLVSALNGNGTTRAKRAVSDGGVLPKGGNGHEMRHQGMDGDVNTARHELNNSEKKLGSSRREEVKKEMPLKLSPEKILELTSSPESLPVSAAAETSEDRSLANELEKLDNETGYSGTTSLPFKQLLRAGSEVDRVDFSPGLHGENRSLQPSPSLEQSRHLQRPSSGGRAVSTPSLRRRSSGTKSGVSNKNATASSSKSSKTAPPPLRFQDTKSGRRLSELDDPEPSPMPISIPVPPLSLPTFLQLELSSHRPSPLYIHRSVTSDFPYESSRVKIERLLNFLLLPPQLESVLWFGALACLDAWLYSFTILPLRFVKAMSILADSWGRNAIVEAQFLSAFIYAGLGRMWRRRRRANSADTDVGKTQYSQTSDTDADKGYKSGRGCESHSSRVMDRQTTNRHRRASARRHRRSKSMPSALLPDHKADILKGLLIMLSCAILMNFDASRMYHSIRGQAAIKLYVIYNVLEVCDRLFSALGQDVLECLFSKESLERRPDGRSKVLRPFWLFTLALMYNLVHATALFYQVITLNVAVNSYSNALLTLLMSNQFVEIKSTVFKKFEKENLFQLTCADVVERFQLWLMLIIIASRNIIETGGLIGTSSSNLDLDGLSPPGPSSSILPKSFTMFPFDAGQVFGPFLIVLGSEMLVDWVKHAYITKFNSTKPSVYGRFLDVLTKDYYSNAFAEQNLTKRLGLPVIPLACLFIRASVQTYHMFLATHMPLPVSSPSTSLSMSSDPTASPVPLTAMSLDSLVRRALGRDVPESDAVTGSWLQVWNWSMDDLLTIMTTVVFFTLVYLVLLLFKLILGILLLRYARHRYRSMKEREGVSVHAEGRRIGGWGVVEVDEDKRRWIYADDVDGARKLRERELEARRRAEEGRGFEGVERYAMVGKRIW